jgi:hypothetical protein
VKLSGNATKLEKILCKDDSRPILTHVFLDVDRRVVEATDSYRLVSIPVDVDDHDVTGLIPRDAFLALQKAHAKHRGGHDTAPALYCNGSCRLEAAGTVQEWPTRPDGQFPDVAKLMPGPSQESAFRIAINARMLADLAAGMGTGDEVELSFLLPTGVAGDEGGRDGWIPNNLRPIVVRPANPSNGEIGLLMPVRSRR